MRSCDGIHESSYRLSENELSEHGRSKGHRSICLSGALQKFISLFRLPGVYQAFVASGYSSILDIRCLEWP